MHPVVSTVKLQKARAQAIVIHSLSGASARKVSSCRPPQPIYALTTENSSVKYLNYSWGVTPVLVEEPETEPSHLYRTENFILQNDAFKKGDCVVITAGQFRQYQACSARGTNLIKILYK